MTKMLEEMAREYFVQSDFEARYHVLMEKMSHEYPSREDFELVAQEIQDMVGEDRFEAFVRDALAPLYFCNILCMYKRNARCLTPQN